MKTDPDEPPTGAIYTRISSDPTGRLAGVKRQEGECRELAERLGIPVTAVRRDNDLSAYSGKPRPGYNELIADIRARRVNLVLAWHPDRLYRRLPDLSELIDAVLETGCEIRTVRAGNVDLTTASGRMQAKILAAVAEHEVEHAIERIKAAKADSVRNGLYRGGPRPFGYEADGVTVRSLACPSCGAGDGFTLGRSEEHGEDAPVQALCGACGVPAVLTEGSEAWHLERAVDAVLAGDSLRSVCRTWSAAGVRTVPRRKRLPDGTRTEPVSREWDATELRGLLLRPRNAGLIEQAGEAVGRAVWVPIVPEEKWRAIRALLGQSDRRTTTGNARVWLGSGLYRCGVEGCTETLRCVTSGVGGKQKARGGKTHRPAYRCRATARHVVRAAAALDDYVQAVLIERLARPDAVEFFAPPCDSGPSARELATQANALRVKLDQYAADYAEDLITRRQMLDGTARTRARLAEVEVQMEASLQSPVLASVPLGSPAIAEAWDGYTLDRRRAVMDAVMVVTVCKARRGRPAGFRPGSGESYFDPDSVDIAWRGRRG